MAKSGRDRDVEEAALALAEDLGGAGDGVGERAVGCDDAQPAGALGDEVAAVGQERDAPGVLEAVGDGARRASATSEAAAGRAGLPGEGRVEGGDVGRALLDRGGGGGGGAGEERRRGRGGRHG